MPESIDIFVDASSFLCMHSLGSSERERAVSFFSIMFRKTLHMSLEQVGLCDDVIWGLSRKSQDEYYPFMDRLHSDMEIVRVPYSKQDMKVAISTESLVGLSPMQALVIAQVINREGYLYTCNEMLLSNAGIKTVVGRVPDWKKQNFIEPLNYLYQRSNVVRLEPEVLNYA